MLRCWSYVQWFEFSAALWTWPRTLLQPLQEACCEVCCAAGSFMDFIECIQQGQCMNLQHNPPRSRPPARAAPQGKSAQRELLPSHVLLLELCVSVSNCQYVCCLHGAAACCSCGMLCRHLSVWLGLAWLVPGLIPGGTALAGGMLQVLCWSVIQFSDGVSFGDGMSL
jgi:hypothetical protein